MHLSKNIKFLRTQMGIKQRELAEKLGVTSTAVGMWEAGAREPELSKIINLSEYFGVTLDDLVLKEMKPPIPVYALNIAYLRREHNMTQAFHKESRRFMRQLNRFIQRRSCGSLIKLKPPFFSYKACKSACKSRLPSAQCQA